MTHQDNFEILPCSQCIPNLPGGHKHSPVIGSQRFSTAQLHIPLHSLPYLPLSQAKMKGINIKLNTINWIFCLEEQCIGVICYSSLGQVSQVSSPLPSEDHLQGSFMRSKSHANYHNSYQPNTS